MIDASNLNLRFLTEVYYLANTPAYLYRRFREDPSVQAIASTHSPADLLVTIDELANKQQRSAGDLAIAYAALVAFTFMPLGEALPALQEWGFGRLQWDRAIWELHLARHIPTQLVTVAGSSLLGQPSPTSSAQNVVVPVTIVK